MRIRPKVTLFVSIFLVVMVILLEILTVYNIRSRGEERLTTFREESLNDVKEHLRDLVDVAYETMEKKDTKEKKKKGKKK